MITGIPGHYIEDVVLENVRISYPGHGTVADAQRVVPEDISRYPEQFFFDVLPAWGAYIRHARNIEFKNVQLSRRAADARDRIILDDVEGFIEDGEFGGVALESDGAAAWVDLLEGDSMELWQSGARDEAERHLSVGELWSLDAGVLSLDREKDGRGGFIVTKKSYGDFELQFEFLINPNGNSGVKYRTDAKGLGLEYQILDDKLHRDNKGNYTLNFPNCNTLTISY